MNRTPTVKAMFLGMVAFAPLIADAAPKTTPIKPRANTQCGTDRNNPSRSDLKNNFVQHGIVMVDVQAAPVLPIENCGWRKQAFQLQSQRVFKLRHRDFSHIPFAVREESYSSAESAANRQEYCLQNPPNASESTKMLIEMRECFRINNKVYLVSTDDTLGLSKLTTFSTLLKQILQHIKPQIDHSTTCAFDSRPVSVKTNRTNQDILVYFFKQSGFKIANNRAPPQILPEDCRWLQEKYGVKARRAFKIRSAKTMTVVSNGFELRNEYVRFVVSEEVYATPKHAIRRATHCNHGRFLADLYGKAALSRTCFVVNNRVYTLASEGAGLTDQRIKLASALRDQLRGK